MYQSEVDAKAISGMEYDLWVFLVFLHFKPGLKPQVWLPSSWTT